MKLSIEIAKGTEVMIDLILVGLAIGCILGCGFLWMQNNGYL